MGVVKLSESRLDAAAGVYARAFFDYPMITDYWPDQARRRRYLDWYLGCALVYGLHYGEVYTTPDVAGIAVWLPPGQTDITIRRYLVSGFLPLPLRMGLRHFLTVVLPHDDVLQKAHAELMRAPHWYLWGLAVAPERQGEGLGGLLMRPGLEQADTGHLPCYLETFDEKNLPFYSKYGFEVASEAQLPKSDQRLWSLIRSAR
jgi:ribosomal protein S18 acetylase RimI-like enzyme